MAIRDDLIAYKARWEEVNAFIAEERRSASIELRWRQLNAAWGMAIGLGLRKADPSENEVHARWAKIKEKAANQIPKA
jgi:hypothetical protein